MSFEYWKECIEHALAGAGIEATQDQIESIAKTVEGSHEVYSEAHGYDVIGDPRDSEIKELRKSLQKERDKTVCKACLGEGRIIENYGTRSSNSQCYECRGEGYI